MRRPLISASFLAAKGSGDSGMGVPPRRGCAGDYRKTARRSSSRETAIPAPGPYAALRAAGRQVVEGAHAAGVVQELVVGDLVAHEREPLAHGAADHEAARAVAVAVGDPVDEPQPVARPAERLEGEHLDLTQQPLQPPFQLVPAHALAQERGC